MTKYLEYIKEKIESIKIFNQNDQFKIKIMLIELVIICHSYFEVSLIKLISKNFNDIKYDEFKDGVWEKVIFNSEKENVISKINIFLTDKKNLRKFKDLINICETFFDKKEKSNKMIMNLLIKGIKTNEIFSLLKNSGFIKDIKIDNELIDQLDEIGKEKIEIETFCKNYLWKTRNFAVHELKLDEDFFIEIYQKSKIEEWFLMIIKTLEELRIIFENFQETKKI